jgi:glycogen synthase
MARRDIQNEKNGGLADAVSALFIALAKLGHEVKIVIPGIIP